MNKYTFTFPFLGEYHFITLTANQMANQVLEQSEDIFDFYEQNDGQDMDTVFFWAKGKKYSINFSFESLRLFNIYTVSDDENEDGSLVDGGENVPWLLVRIEDEDGNKIYGLSDYV